MAMLIDLFRHEQLVKHLEFRIVIMGNLFNVWLLRSTFYETSLIFSVHSGLLSRPVVAAAALPITLLILLDSVSMLLAVRFRLSVTRFRSP